MARLQSTVFGAQKVQLPRVSHISHTTTGYTMEVSLSLGMTGMLLLPLPNYNKFKSQTVTGSVLADATPTYSSADAILSMQSSFSCQFRDRLPFLTRHRQALKLSTKICFATRLMCAFPRVWSG